MGSQGEDEQFYQQQVQSIQQIFARFDSDGTGKVKVSQIGELMTALGRDPKTGKEVQRVLSGRGGVENVSFEEVVQTLKQLEEAAIGDGRDPDTTTPLTLLKRLHSYRRHCEKSHEYAEAKKARRKYDELRMKEEERQRKLVEQAQQHEMNEVEQAQKQQFLEFSSSWDRYMADYESTAYMSLERLKEQHAQEFASFQERMRKQSKPCKFSRELLELRHKQQSLAKLGKYEEAFKVKDSADHLEQWEAARHASIQSDSSHRQEHRVPQQQQKALAALLKRIQRDRGEQIRHRQVDSQRLIQRNKNLKADLSKKQHLEHARAGAAIKSIMSQPDHAQKLLDEHDPAYVARSAAMGELPALGKIRWKGPSLPEGYQPPGAVHGGIVAPRTKDGRLQVVYGETI